MFRLYEAKYSVILEYSEQLLVNITSNGVLGIGLVDDVTLSKGYL